MPQRRSQSAQHYQGGTGPEGLLVNAGTVLRIFAPEHIMVVHFGIMAVWR
jgi:hypothetical protein